ncbi:MAG TPA: AI-2E family transporter, partial [Anaerolineales bacterium]
MKRGLAILLTYLMGLILLAVLLFLVLGPLLTELEQASNRLTDAYQQLVGTWPSGTSFQQAIAARLPPTDALLAAITGQESFKLAQAVLGVAQTFLGVVSQLAIVVVLSIYWSADRVHFERLWLSLLPARERTRAREIWRSIEKGVGAYIRSELVRSMVSSLLRTCLRISWAISWACKRR